MHKLIIEDDEGKQVVVPLIRDEITIGRQEGNTIRLTEQNISRKHARFVRESGNLFIEDAGSYNGIKVNGVRITARAALNDGDQILVGDYKLGIKVDAGKTQLYGQQASARPVAVAPVAVAAPAPAPLAPIIAAPPAAPAPAPLPGDGSAVPDEIEGQPTIPVRTLADQGLLPGASKEPPARLVVVSTPLAGNEFLLDRPSLVMGRTPENDIMLNHKSISRHHAKIIRDGDRYVVVDLQSANGVRVNGQEQERAELGSGDVIELGHVRLRFVAGNDTYGYEPGAVRIGKYEVPKKAAIGVGAGVAAVLLIVVVLVVRGGGSSSEAEKKPVAVAPPPAAPAPPAPPVAPPPKPSAASVPALLASARAAQQAGNWTGAQKAVDDALAADPTSVDAKQLRTTIEGERTAADGLIALKKQLATGDVASAQTTLASMADGTKARATAAPLVDAAKTSFVATHLAAAKKLEAAGRCDDLKQETGLVLAVDSHNRGAHDLETRCKDAATTTKTPTLASATPTRPAPAPRTTHTAAAATPAAPHAPPAEAEAPAPAGDPDDLLAQAQDSWAKGQFAAAIESSRKALRIRPGLTRAYQIIAVCSCSLRDQPSAARAYDKLDDKTKSLVKSLCQRSGIALE